MTETGERMLQILPTRINKEDEIIQALFANTKGTGALEKMFNDGQTILNSYAKNKDVYSSQNEILDRAVEFFSYLERNYDESDENLIKRMQAIFVRCKDTTWGTTWNIRHVFEQYFPYAEVFLLENFGDYENTLDSVSEDIDKNYIKGGIFTDLKEWEIDKTELTSDESFIGDYGALIQKTGQMSQSVVLDEGFYFLSFFYIGSMKMTVQCKKGNEIEILPLNLIHNNNLISIKNGSCYVSSENEHDSWQLFNAYFENKEKNADITLLWQGIDDCYVDMITLFKKYQCPKFSILCRFSGESANETTLHLARGKEDPAESGYDNENKPVVVGDKEFGKTNKTIIYDENGNEKINYKGEKMFDNSYVTGAKGDIYAQDIYEDILNMIKPCGVKAYIKVVNHFTKNKP